jgi:hypothetical protein
MTKESKKSLLEERMIVEEGIHAIKTVVTEAVEKKIKDLRTKLLETSKATKDAIDATVDNNIIQIIEECLMDDGQNRDDFVHTCNSHVIEYVAELFKLKANFSDAVEKQFNTMGLDTPNLSESDSKRLKDDILDYAINVQNSVLIGEMEKLKRGGNLSSNASNKQVQAQKAIKRFEAFNWNSDKREMAYKQATKDQAFSLSLGTASFFTATLFAVAATIAASTGVGVPVAAVLLGTSLACAGAGMVHSAIALKEGSQAKHHAQRMDHEEKMSREDTNTSLLRRPSFRSY